MFLEVKKTGIWFVKKLDLFLGTNKNKTPRSEERRVGKEC